MCSREFWQGHWGDNETYEVPVPMDQARRRTHVRLTYEYSLWLIFFCFFRGERKLLYRMEGENEMRGRRIGELIELTELWELLVYYMYL